MIGLSSKKPARIFLQIFVPFVLSLITFIFVIAFILYFDFQNVVLGMVYKDSESNLRSVSNSVSDMEQNLNSLALRCYFDNSLSDLLYYSPSVDRYSTFYNCLYSYKNIFPFIDSLYVYNGENFYICPGYSFANAKLDFSDKDIVRILGDAHAYPSNSLIPRRLDSSLFSDGTGKSLVYTYLFYDSQPTNGSVSRAIILNVSADLLKQNIDSFNNDGGRILIIDGKGRVMTDDSVDPALSDLSGQPYITKILQSGGGSGYFICNVNGRSSLVTYVTTDVMNWKCISVTPYDQIMAQTRAIRNGVELTGLVILLLGIFVTLFLSRRLFVPVESLVTDFTAINDEKRKNFYKNKQEILVGYVTGGNLISAQQLKEYAFKIDFRRNVAMLLLDIDHFAQFCRDYNLHDRGLRKLDIINMTGEILSGQFLCECVEIHECGILVLATPAGETGPENADIVKLAREIQQAIRNRLGLSVTVTIGRRDCPPTDICEEYQRILDASEYKIISGTESVILANEVHFKPTENFVFPAEKEKAMIDAVMQGQSAEAAGIIREITDDAVGFGSSGFNTTTLHLLLSLDNAISVLRKNNGMALDFDFDRCLDEIRRQETVRDVLDVFIRLFDSISNELDKSRHERHARLLENVVEIVNLQYASADLCLESIAELVKISPYYLSKLFRKYKFVSLNDYINNVRLEKARDIILNQSDSISDVMKKTGFTSSSHFYTLFKKVYGVSPNQLRKTSGT